MANIKLDELKAFCQWFHEAGENEIPFDKAWELFLEEAKSRG